MTGLPTIMVAPNGARRTKADHSALPVTVDELIMTCRSCAAAGAGGVHAHVRDAFGSHSLDAGLYRSVIERLREELPGWFVQVTSETAGRYGAAAQRDLIRTLHPRSVSVAVREFVPNVATLAAARDTYQWAHDEGVVVQHICYSREELERLLAFIDDGTIPGKSHQLQLVLGSYDGRRISRPEDIAPFLRPVWDRQDTHAFDWMLCAFGPQETDCLLKALELGGKARIGFENSLWNRDGSLAADNAERVTELVRMAGDTALACTV